MLAEEDRRLLSPDGTGSDGRLMFMPKVSFRMASASYESVFGVQTSTARKNHRSGHTEGQLNTRPRTNLSRRTFEVESITVTLMTVSESESPADRYRRLAERFTVTVDAVPDDAWNDASPCDGWTAKDVLIHVIDSEAGLLKKTGQSVSFEPVARDEPTEAWAHVRNAAQAALDDPERAGIEYEGFGSRTTLGATFSTFMCVDLVVHRWDIAHAAGVDDSIPAEDMSFVRTFTEEMGDMAQTSGAFGPPRSVSDNASEQTKLLALLGRSVN